MAAERLSMRTIKEVLRLKWEKKFSNKQIAQSCNIARSTVREYVARAENAGLAWPQAAGLDDSRLEALLFPPPATKGSPSREVLDMKYIHRELAEGQITSGEHKQHIDARAEQFRQKHDDWVHHANPLYWSFYENV